MFVIHSISTADSQEFYCPKMGAYDAAARLAFGEFVHTNAEHFGWPEGEPVQLSQRVVDLIGDARVDLRELRDLERQISAAIMHAEAVWEALQ